ncbi:MAG: Rid family detoxifying hydrolase [Dehalococcoidia bacterium]|nr:Rid family detoxifying hydrolase [Dehalococcoidia bacterium]
MALVNRQRIIVDRTVIATAAAPAAIGAYSQAIRWGDLIFLSGQIALDPVSGHLIDGDSVAQLHQVMANATAVLEAAGSDLAHVVKVTLYLTDLSEFAQINEAYSQYFTHTPPARSTVQVARLPRDARVELDMIAVRA